MPGKPALAALSKSYWLTIMTKTKHAVICSCMMHPGSVVLMRRSVSGLRTARRRRPRRAQSSNANGPSKSQLSWPSWPEAAKPSGPKAPS